MILLSEWGKSTVKNSLYESEDGYLVLFTSGKYKASVKLDLNTKDLIQTRVWSVRTRTDGSYVILSLGERVSMIRFVYNYLKDIDLYSKDLALFKLYEKNSLDFDMRLSNLTGDYKETYKKDEKLKVFQGTFEKTREKVLEGLKTNRYDNNYSKKLRESKLGVNNISTKLNEDIVIEIRRLAEEGYSHSLISEMFKVFRTTISDIVNYRIWNDYLMDSDDVKHINELKEIKMDLNKSIEGLNLNLNLFDNGKGYVDVITGRKYLTVTKEKQLYIEVLEKDGKFIYSFTLRLMTPSGRNKWRNYGIILMNGDKTKLPKREILYKIFENLALSIS